ncbi:MAG TPA: response regulator [Pyrinomonadaceae bacterium]|nr:response regulator [Pyrinomonadaceae bacterium]
MAPRILIIDDEEHIRRMMRLTLEAAGYETGEAPDGPEGIKLFGDGSNWSLVVLDQRMPGMDGLGTLRELRKRNGSARVVMATAYASIELAVDAMKLGATDFVRKPMTPEVLRNSIAAALAKSPIETGTSTTASATTPAPQPLIQTITMNGFTIVDDKESPTLEEHRRRFVVVSPEGEKHEVVIDIQNEPIEYLQRVTGRYLAPENSFWTVQARSLLSDFLWNEGKAPPMHRLVLTSLDPEKVPVAARWKA